MVVLLCVLLCVVSLFSVMVILCLLVLIRFSGWFSGLVGVGVGSVFNWLKLRFSCFRKCCFSVVCLCISCWCMLKWCC